MSMFVDAYNKQKESGEQFIDIFAVKYLTKAFKDLIGEKVKITYQYSGFAGAYLFYKNNKVFLQVKLLSEIDNSEIDNFVNILKLESLK